MATQAHFVLSLAVARFTTQFFYSPEIFNIIVENPGNGTAVAQFITDWMNAYASTQLNPPPNELCKSLANMTSVPGFETIADVCDFFALYNFSWAISVQAMLDATATTFGDTNFAERKASWDNRNSALQNTDLYIQISLTPNSRVREGDDGNNQVISFLGPSGLNKSFSVALPLVYAVKDNYTFYNIAVEENFLPIIAGILPSPGTFGFKDWSDFYLFSPDQNGVSPGNILTTIDNLTVDGPFQEPFTGGADVIQVAAASSATLGDVSGSSPSMLAQLLSTISFGITNAAIPLQNKLALQKFLDEGGSAIYRTPGFDDLAVCSQWPANCTKMDGRLNDGGFTDGPSVAMNIGQYQTTDDGDLTVPIKLIVTNNNFFLDSNVPFLAYFNTTFNQEAEPGGFDWAPPLGPGVAQRAPWRSMRIFAEYLDDALMLNAFEPIEGTNLTTATFTATTIDNPAFGVKAGQTVEILLLQINSYIPTIILGLSATTLYAQPLAEMAFTISSNEVLVQRITDFLSFPLGAVSPTRAPTPPTSTKPTFPTTTSGAPHPASASSPTVSPVAMKPTLPTTSGAPHATFVVSMIAASIVASVFF